MEQESQYDGWANSATQGWVMVAMNDRRMYERLRESVRTGLNSGVVGEIPREDWWVGTVDIVSVYWQLAEEMAGEGEISEDRLTRVHHTLLEGRFAQLTEQVRGQKLLKQITKKGDKDMKITTTHAVNGINVSTMTLNDKIEVLRDCEARINELKAITTPSKLVAAELEKVEAFLVEVNALFDADLPETKGRK